MQCDLFAQSSYEHGLHTFTYHSGYYLCVGHNFIAFVAESPYEQAGPETNVVQFLLDIFVLNSVAAEIEHKFGKMRNM